MTRNPGSERDDLRSLLEMYALGEGTDEERRTFQERLEASESLQKELEAVRRILAATRSEPSVPSLSTSYYRRRRALFDRVQADCLSRESVLSRAMLGLAATVAVFRDRFRASVRFRFLVIFAAAQAVLILVIALGLLSEHQKDRSGTPGWSKVARDESDRIRDDDLEGAVPRGPREERYEPGPIKIRIEDPLQGPVGSGKTMPRLVWGDEDRVVQRLFRSGMRQAREDQTRRMGLVFRRGGGLRTESAVKRGLAWLARRQAGDGRFAVESAREGSEIGASALATLAFLGHGLTDANHRKIVEQGIGFLERQQQADGFIGPRPGVARTSLDTLGHALATQAMLEASLMGIEVPSDAVQKAIGRLDMTELTQPAVVGQAGLVLLMAKSLGFRAGGRTLEHCLAWFDRPENRQRFGGQGPAALTFNAGRVLLEDLTGKKSVTGLRSDPSVALGRLPEGVRTNELLGWLFASQALIRSGDSAAWDRWNNALVEDLTGRQAADGGFAWKERGNPEADGVSPTAAGVLMLQVYYRYGAL